MSQGHGCSQLILDIIVMLLRQMPNSQCTSLLCLGAVLAHSSGVFVYRAFVVLQDKTAPNTDAFISQHQHLKALRLPTGGQCNSFNTGVMWSCLLVRVISLAALFWTRCNRAVCDNGMVCILCKRELQ